MTEGGEDKPKPVPKKSKWKLVLVAINILVIIGLAVYFSGIFEKKPAPQKSVWGDFKKDIQWNENRLRIADCIIFEYMIQLEKLNRTMDLDIELAGSKAGCYGEPVSLAKEKEEKRLLGEISRLKGLLEKSREEKRRIEEKLYELKKPPGEQRKDKSSAN